MKNQSPYNDDCSVVKQVDKNNRGLFTKCEIKPWGTVLNLQPIALSLITSMKDKFCNYCVFPGELVRCSQCKCMYYCSKDCQRKDWEIHKEECPIYAKMVKDKQLSPLKNITAEFALNLRVYLLRRKYPEIDKRVSSMVDLLDVQIPEKLNFFQEMATALMENIGLEKNAENLSNLIKQLSIVSLNGFTVQDYMCSEQVIGPALYWPANFINHDCQPNCTQIYEGRTLKILANRPLHQGEQITISYTPALDDYEKKKNILRQGYLFQCFCDFCQVNQMFDWSTFYLLCPDCKTKSLSASKQKGIVANCKKCNKAMTENQYQKIHDSIQNLSEEVLAPGTDYAVAKKCMFAIKKMVDFSSPQFQPLLHRVYMKAIEQGQNYTKFFEEAYILLKQMIQNMPKWFRLEENQQIPYTYVWKYAEMGKLAYNINKKKKAFEYTEKAFDILKKINFKRNLPEVKELQKRVGELKIAMSFDKAEAFRKS